MRGWSQRLDDRRRRELVALLRARFPLPPSLGAPPTLGDPAPATPSAPSPLALAERLHGRRGFLWLDGGAESRHFLLADPHVTLEARSGRARVRGAGAELRLRCRGFDLLEAALEAFRDAGSDALLAGYLGYELAHEIEDLPPPPPDDLGLPDLYLALYTRPQLREGSQWTPSPAAREMPLQSPQSSPSYLSLFSTPITFSRPSRDGFRRGVATLVDRIAAGEIFQANLCRRLEAPLPAAAAWPLYLALRAVSPARHGAFLNLGRGRALLSISPETFLSVRGRQVATLPIKGTRPRGASPAEDAALARELLRSEKERAELTMIVDVARNDLGRVCRSGSVRVESHAELMTLPTVHHTVSRVAGTLRDEIGPVELLRATFPPASISGAPKIRAMTLLGALEERRRGPAMGALGWIGCDGDLELSVAIRTAVAARGRIAYHAGCGIVADSDPQEELDESSAKARAFLCALGAAEAE